MLHGAMIWSDTLLILPVHQQGFWNNLSTDKNIRFFQPCTSNMFGEAEQTPQDENTRFNPMSPYACAKVSAYYFTKYYRKSRNICVDRYFIHHESPRRTKEYVTRKITSSVAGNFPW